MASLPAQQPSQRRPLSEQSQTPSSQPQTTPSPARAQSEDSQTIFVHTPDEAVERQKEEQQPQIASTPADEEEESSAKKCWICFADSTEDTVESSPWRDPCPCALVAHEECLLDWIADMEAPKNPRNRNVTAPKIECPQCKSEIKLSRPRNFIVDGMRVLEQLGAKAVTPAAAMTLFGAVYSSSMACGIHTIYAVFGAEDGFRILRPLIYNATRAPIEVYAGSPHDAAKQVLMVLIDHLLHWRLYIGLPLITPTLILSRTSFADGVLPVLPIVFFASQAHSHQDAIDLSQWPPSASFAFAVLPYVRSLYNVYYQKVWAEKEKRWLSEIQPRVGQNQGNDGGDGANANQDGPGRRPADDENIFEVRIDGGLWEEWEEEEQPEQNALNNALLPPPGNVDGGFPPLGVEQNGAEAPALDGQQPLIGEQAGLQQPPEQQQQRPNQQPGGERRLSFSPTAIAETILGALVFPTIAGLSGEALKLVLPTAWIAASVQPGRINARLTARGLLQQKWGRSLVGGCLFVVCKDALKLYVRWKMAQMHRQRRIVDFDRKKANTRTAST